MTQTSVIKWVVVVLHNMKYLQKKISDIVTLGTFCYRDLSFINRRGSVIFFVEGEVLSLTPPPTPTHTKHVEKILTPSDETF